MTNMQSNYGLDPNLTITCPLNQWPKKKFNPMAITCKFNSLASYWHILTVINTSINLRHKKTTFIYYERQKMLHQEFQKCILELKNTQQDMYAKQKSTMSRMQSAKCWKEKSRMSIKCP